MSFGENSGITAIRTIRVLRPLRAINKYPSKDDTNEKNLFYSLATLVFVIIL